MTTGSGDGQINFPYNVDFSLDGHTVYVSDTGNNRVVRWDITAPTARVSSRTSGATAPSHPQPCADPPADFGCIDTLRRVVVDPDGN